MLFFTSEELEEKYPDRVYRRNGWTVIINKTTDKDYIVPFTALRAWASETREGEVIENNHCEHCI